MHAEDAWKKKVCPRDCNQNLSTQGSFLRSPHSGARTVTAANHPTLTDSPPTSWSVLKSMSLSPGLYTIAVEAGSACIGCYGTFVGGTTGSPLQSELTVTVLKH